MKKLVMALVATLALVTGLFVAPVAGDRPAVQAAAHTTNVSQVCGAFFDGKRSTYTVTGYYGRYLTHTRETTTRYRVTYSWYRTIPGLPTDTHTHTYICNLQLP